jgi:hypothetical protein
MEKYDSVIIAIAIIFGAVIVGGAVLLGSSLVTQVFPHITIDSKGNSTEILSGDYSGYLTPINDSELKNYNNSCIQLENSIIPKNLDSNSLVGKKVKFKGKIVSIDSNSSIYSDLLVQSPELSNYPYVVVTYGSSAPFKTGTAVIVYGEYGGLASLSDVNEDVNKMVPMIQAVYLQKS